MTITCIERRAQLRSGAAMLLGTLPLWSFAADRTPTVEIWKTAACGCCKDWIQHLQANGFPVRAYDLSDMAKREQRRRLGLEDKFGSCHTARVAGYLLEGHVPARDILRLLKEKPRALGLAVPGMPIGSPGMDGPEYGGHKDPYDVLLVQRDGSASVYQSYR